MTWTVSTPSSWTRGWRSAEQPGTSGTPPVTSPAPRTSTSTTTWPLPRARRPPPASRPRSFRGRGPLRRHLARLTGRGVRRRTRHRGRATLVAAARLLPRRRARPRRGAGGVDRGRPPLSMEPCTRSRRLGRSPGRLPVVEADDVPAVVRDGILIDVRAAQRYRGELEPIDPVAGHVPGAVNAPLTENTDEIGRFLPDAALARDSRRSASDDGVPVAAYCGSGVTATQTPAGPPSRRLRRRRPLPGQLERVDHRPVPPGRHG